MESYFDLDDVRHSVILPGMAYLFRSRTTNPATGRKYCSRKWHGKWKSSTGRWISKALSEDKRTARKMLLKLAAEDEKEAAGLGRRRLSLMSLLGQFRDGLATHSTTEYAQMTFTRIKAVLDAIDAANPDHIEPGKVQIAVAQLADSLRTRNHYTAAVKQFCRWLVDNGHAKRNPVTGLKPAKHEADKRYVRRALTLEEWQQLTQATAASPKTFRGLDGNARLMLYYVVLSTGWRAGGLAELRVRDFHEDGLVIMEAKYSKNRREQRKYLPATVHRLVWEYLQEKGINEKAWPGTWAQDAAEMLRIDLEDAGIPHKTDEGVMDFHAFRNTSITWMLEAGTPIYLVQKHADHANPAQTMKYARPKRDHVDDAIAQTFTHIISHKKVAYSGHVEAEPSSKSTANSTENEKGPREDA